MITEITTETKRGRRRTESPTAEVIRTYTDTVYPPGSRKSNDGLFYLNGELVAGVQVEVKRYSTGSLPGGPQGYTGDELIQRRRDWDVYLDGIYIPEHELYTEDLIVPGRARSAVPGSNKKKGDDDGAE